MKTNTFLYWLFEKRDIDGLVIAIILANAIEMFTKDVSNAILEPIIVAFLPTHSKQEQTLQIGSMEFKFKIQLLIAGLVRLVINCWIAYQIMTFVKSK